MIALLFAAPAFAATLTVVSTRLTVWQSATSVPAAACASPGTHTASANADSWIDQNSAASNFGTDAIIKVRSQSANNNSRALVRFALPALPAGCAVTDAKLRLYAGSSTAGRTLQASRINAAWTEGVVSWAVRPATTGAAATTTSGAGYHEWTVTNQAAPMYSGANHGFMIRDATENGDGSEQSCPRPREGS